MHLKAQCDVPRYTTCFFVFFVYVYSVVVKMNLVTYIHDVFNIMFLEVTIIKIVAELSLLFSESLGNVFPMSCIVTYQLSSYDLSIKPYSDTECRKTSQNSASGYFEKSSVTY